MRSLVALSCLFASACTVAAPVAYTFDPAHTHVQFSWNHLQYSNPEAGFDDVSGTLMRDADHLRKLVRHHARREHGPNCRFLHRYDEIRKTRHGSPGLAPTPFSSR